VSRTPSVTSYAQQIVTLHRVSYHGHAFRHQSPNYDPRSGEGAKLFGGRFNPPGSYATLYLAPTVTTVAAELFRLGERQAVGVDALLPRDLYMYSLDLGNVVDLTSTEAKTLLPIDKPELTSHDHTVTRLIGEFVFSLGAPALLSYSAACDGLVIAVFPENLHGCDLRPELIDSWASMEQIPSFSRSNDTDAASTGIDS
jgi:RES domain-containing protein